MKVMKQTTRHKPSSPRPTSRAQRKEATRQRILEAARACVAEMGCDKATIDIIAGRAGVLAIEAGTTLMLRLPELVALADARRVALVGVSAAFLRLTDASESA
jgi:hypothetical protein